MEGCGEDRSCASVKAHQLQCVLGNAHSTSVSTVHERVNTRIDPLRPSSAVRDNHQLWCRETINGSWARTRFTSQDGTRKTFGLGFMLAVVYAI